MGGNLCGVSTGEALSRWCAAVISNNALADFATASQWAQDGMRDYVNQTDPTDQNADSTGCGMAFLSWLMSQGHGLDQIAQTMVSLGDTGTLAQLYANLTSDAASNAWAAFLAAVEALPVISGANDDPLAERSSRRSWRTSLLGRWNWRAKFLARFSRAWLQRRRPTRSWQACVRPSSRHRQQNRPHQPRSPRAHWRLAATAGPGDFFPLGGR